MLVVVCWYHTGSIVSCSDRKSLGYREGYNTNKDINLNLMENLTRVPEKFLLVPGITMEGVGWGGG